MTKEQQLKMLEEAYLKKKDAIQMKYQNSKTYFKLNLSKKENEINTLMSKRSKKEI